MGTINPPRYKNLTESRCFAHATETAAATDFDATGVRGCLLNFLPVFHALLKSFANDFLFPYDIGVYLPPSGGIEVHGDIGGPGLNGCIEQLFQ